MTDRIDNVISMLEQRGALRAQIAEAEAALAAIPREFTEGDPNTDPAAARQVLDRIDRSDALAAGLRTMKKAEADIEKQVERLQTALGSAA